MTLLQCPIIKERRRFTDVMEEESVNQRESRLTAWGRDDFSVYKMHKGAQESVEIQVFFKYVVMKNVESHYQRHCCTFIGDSYPRGN